MDRCEGTQQTWNRHVRPCSIRSTICAQGWTAWWHETNRAKSRTDLGRRRNGRHVLKTPARGPVHGGL
eukprot:11188506-Lingulodinium_polyedra.AAC.1